MANNQQDKPRPDGQGRNNPGAVSSASQSGATGPNSIQGVEARDLPDGGRGPVDQNIGKAMARKTPDHTGGTIGGDVGIRAMPGAADADDHGHRKHS